MERGWEDEKVLVYGRGRQQCRSALTLNIHIDYSINSIAVPAQAPPGVDEGLQVVVLSTMSYPSRFHAISTCKWE